MYSTPTLATRFARNTRVLRADAPLSEDQMRGAAPSVFAEGKRSAQRHGAEASVMDARRGPRIWSSDSGASARSTRVLRAKRVASVGVEYMSVPSINGV